MATGSGDAPRPSRRTKGQKRLGHILERHQELLAGARSAIEERGDGQAWDRLADLHVISGASATRLQNVKEMRNELAHAYPPASWRALHQAVEILLEDLDSYKVKLADWLVDQGVLQR